MNKKSLFLGIVFLAIDQISKSIIDAFIELGSTYKVINNLFYITNIENTGAAFSILEDKVWFLIPISLVIIVLLWKISKDFKENIRNRIAFGLLIGGIFGNLSDRIFLGFVRDFLKVKIFGYNFPIFNFADVFIVIGVALLIISIFKGEDSSGNSSRKRRVDKNRQVLE